MALSYFDSGRSPVAPGVPGAPVDGASGYSSGVRELDPDTTNRYLMNPGMPVPAGYEFDYAHGKGYLVPKSSSSGLYQVDPYRSNPALRFRRRRRRPVTVIRRVITGARSGWRRSYTRRKTFLGITPLMWLVLASIAFVYFKFIKS
jgi:hypothetical protein